MHGQSRRRPPFIQGQLEAFVGRAVRRPLAVTHRWAGIWGETFDLLPLAGRVPGHDRLWVAGGYSGHGNVLGLACGDLVARAILGDVQPSSSCSIRLERGPGLVRTLLVTSRAAELSTA